MYNYSKNYNFNSNKDKIKDKIKKIKTNNSGITIVALVVTIIVLLILAGITIGTITGDNGIINKAQEAKNDTNYAQWEEKIDQAIIDAESKHRNPTWPDVIEELKSKGVITSEDQVDKKTGAITTNEPKAIIEGKLNDYIEFGPGMIADKNETYNDGKDTAIIPAGFEILEEASTIKDGLVIQDEQGNQFVWIPVKTAVANSEADGTNNKAMAIKDGDNYRGLLYNFTSGTNGTPSTSTVRSGCTTTTSSYREPDVLSYSTCDPAHFADAGYGSLDEMKQGLQSEYNNMITSVDKNGGFYIGRYELGLEGTTPVSKNASTTTGVTTADASNSSTSMWYGLYKKCKEYIPQDSSSVVSTMTWGSQYDAMMNWMQNNDNKNGVDVTATGTVNTTSVTGSNSNDNIKNIFDLYGCHREWTLEANGTSSRVFRGGYSSYSYAPSYRHGYVPGGTSSGFSARLTLYIK